MRYQAFAFLMAVGFMVMSGCAGASQSVRMARASEVVCKHCNCLMPAGTDPESTCTVCQCGFKAHRCVRGH